MKTIFAFLLVSLIINIDEITCKDKVTSEEIDQNTERYLTKSEVASKQTEVQIVFFREQSQSFYHQNDFCFSFSV